MLANVAGHGHGGNGERQFGNIFLNGRKQCHRIGRWYFKTLRWCKLASHNYRPQTEFAKVMFLHVSVILSTGGCLLQWGCLLQGGSAPGGVPAPGGCLLHGGVETPDDGYCCWWYASYWNAFLLNIVKVSRARWLWDSVTKMF